MINEIIIFKKNPKKQALWTLTCCPLRASYSHAAAVLSDAVVCDLGDDVRVGLQVEQEDVVRLQIPIDDHGWVKVPDHTGLTKKQQVSRFLYFTRAFKSDLEIFKVIMVVKI